MGISTKPERSVVASSCAASTRQIALLVLVLGALCCGHNPSSSNRDGSSSSGVESAVDGAPKPELLYFTVWVGCCDNVAPHVDSIKKHAETMPGYKIVADAETKRYLEERGVELRFVDLDTDVFERCPDAVKSRVIIPAVHERVDRLYDEMLAYYEFLKSTKMYSSASEVLRYVAFGTYHDAATGGLVYHDAGVRLEAPTAEQTARLSEGAPFKVVLIGDTLRWESEIHDKFAFLDPEIVAADEGVPHAQFNSDLLYVKSGAVAQGTSFHMTTLQYKVMQDFKTAFVTETESDESYLLQDVVTSDKLERSAFRLDENTNTLFYENTEDWYRFYKPTRIFRHDYLKDKYTEVLVLKTLDVVLQAEADKIYRVHLTRESAEERAARAEAHPRDLLHTLRSVTIEGGDEVRRAFIEHAALDPRWVGAISRRDGRKRFGSSVDVPLYTRREHTIRSMDDPPDELDAEATALATQMGACGFGESRRRRRRGTCSLIDENEYAMKTNGEFVYQDKYKVKLLNRLGELRVALTERLSENVLQTVKFTAPRSLVDALIRKRDAAVKDARAQLKSILDHPGARETLAAATAEAYDALSPEHRRETKTLARAYARAATRHGLSQEAVKFYVAGARVYGMAMSAHMLVASDDPFVKTFASIDMANGVNGLLAAKLMKHAETAELGQKLASLSDNPVMHAAGLAANVFFFAQSVRNVAGGHHSFQDYYWLGRSSMQLMEMVFESLSAASMPMMAVDVLVMTLTQIEYAEHTVRSVANSLPLDQTEMWALGGAAFFGAQSLTRYYDDVKRLHVLNNNVANAAMRALGSVNIAVAFPVTIAQSTWLSVHGEECASGYSVTPTHEENITRDLSDVDFRQLHSYALTEKYIGDVTVQDRCIAWAKNLCGRHKRLVRTRAAPMTGGEVSADECALFDGSIPDFKRSCLTQAKLERDKLDRKCLVPSSEADLMGTLNDAQVIGSVLSLFGVRTPIDDIEIPQHLLYPSFTEHVQRKTGGVVKSFPSGNTRKTHRPSQRGFLGSSGFPQPFIVESFDAFAYGPDFNGSACRPMLQEYTTLSLAPVSDTVLNPYIVSRALKGSERPIALYLNAPLVRIQKINKRIANAVELLPTFYRAQLVAQKNTSAIINVRFQGIYRGAADAETVFLVGPIPKSAAYEALAPIVLTGGSATDTIVLDGAHVSGTLFVADENLRLKTRSVTMAGVNLESVKAPDVKLAATLGTRFHLETGAGSSVTCDPGSEYSVLELGEGSTLRLATAGAFTVIARGGAVVVSWRTTWTSAT